jgi:hypothetical protein
MNVTRGTKLAIAKCYTTVGGTKATQKKQDEPDSWDTDSFEVKVDSGCSVSLSGDIKDFIPGTLTETKGGISIQSYGGGRTAVTQTGTILWKVMDDAN